MTSNPDNPASDEGQFFHPPTFDGAAGLARQDLSELGFDVASNPGLISLTEAREVMGEGNVVGPEEIKQFLNIDIKDIPPIPYSRKELENAKAEGFQLRLRVDKDNDGKSLTVEHLNEVISPKPEFKDKEGAFIIEDYLKDEPFYTTETPRVGWCLQQNEFVPNSRNKNLLQQAEVILAYLKNRIFDDPTKETQRQKAVKEAEKVLPQIARLDSLYDARTIVTMLSGLEINNYRRSPAEALFDRAVSLGLYDPDMQKSEPFSSNGINETTKSCTTRGTFVSIGQGAREGFHAGVHSGNLWPNQTSDIVGVVLSV